MIINKEVDFKDDIISKRGYVVVTRELMLNSSEEELRAFFTNFFPISIHDTLDFSSFGTLRYYGMSPLFKKINEGEISPQYEFTLETLSDGSIDVTCEVVSNTIF
jgi:hypothetical protein